MSSLARGVSAEDAEERLNLGAAWVIADDNRRKGTTSSIWTLSDHEAVRCWHPSIRQKGSEWKFRTSTMHHGECVAQWRWGGWADKHLLLWHICREERPGFGTSINPNLSSAVGLVVPNNHERITQELRVPEISVSHSDPTFYTPSVLPTLPRSIPSLMISYFLCSIVTPHPRPRA